MNDKATVRAIQLIVNEISINDSDKIDIILRIIEIANDVNVVNNTKACDKDGWYLWDAAKEDRNIDFIPEHIRGKQIQVRFIDGTESRGSALADGWDFSDLNCGATIAAYRIVE